MFKESATLYDKIYSWKDYKKESEEITSVILSKRPACKKILDIACGTGEHHVYLKDKFDVDGIDILQEFVDIAVPKNKKGKYFKADMRSFDLGENYNAVICLFSSIGYLRSVSEIVSALKCFANHLNPEGVILVEPWFTKETWSNGKVGMVANDMPGLKICRMNESASEGDFSVVDFQYMIAEDGKGVKCFTERHELRMTSNNEMLDAFKQAGLKVEFDPKGLIGRGMFWGTKTV
jgi:trans-aconitate methyltransferase